MTEDIFYTIGKTLDPLRIDYIGSMAVNPFLELHAFAQSRRFVRGILLPLSQ
jgi:hypothetical protein